VTIGFPHTSNGDVCIFAGVANPFDVKGKFLIKGAVTRWPCSLILIAAEGTWAKASHRRSGFWRIADAAEVPVVDLCSRCSFTERPNKAVSGQHKVAGDPEASVERAHAFCVDERVPKPKNVGPIEL